MSGPSPEENIDELRSRAEEDPTNHSIRFELGKRLLQSGSHSESIPHLQAASRHPRYRLPVFDLVTKQVDCSGIQDVMDEARQLTSDSLDCEQPPDENNDA